MHPPAFRKRFCDEMLSIFDEGGVDRFAFHILVDGVISLARQWLLRTNCWKILIAICGAFLQVLWFVYPRRSHQSWTASPQPLTPHMQQLVAVTLLVLCSLFVMILLLTVWTIRLERRRSERRGVYVAARSLVGYTTQVNGRQPKGNAASRPSMAKCFRFLSPMKKTRERRS